MTETNLNAVRVRRLAIAKEISKLRAEEAELSVAERVLARLSGAPQAAEPSPRSSVVSHAAGPRTQKEFVLETLSSSESPWLKSSEIVETVRRVWGADIAQKSLRPLLSVMKRDGLIVRQGRLVALTDRVSGATSPARAKR